MTTVEEAILARRSTKFFEDRPIDADLLDRIIELTLAAPSSFNLQPWRLVVIRDAEQRAAIRAASFHQPQFEHAAVTLVFAVTLKGWREHLQEVTDQGFASGAWPTEFEETIRNSIDGFQTDLERRGKIREYAIKDAMIAATHTVLAAQSLGVASCFMNGWDEAAIKAVIGAEGDDDLAIAVLVPLGYPAAEARSPGRLPRGRTVFDERL